MRRIHKGLLKWEDIEIESQATTDQNFLPESLIQNTANRDQTNASASSTIAKNVETNKNNDPLRNGTSNNIVMESNINGAENVVRNLNFTETNKAPLKNNDASKTPEILEDFEEEDEDYVPIEVINAPDFDLPDPEDDDEDDENLDLNYLDLERKIKKLKPDQEEKD